MERSEAMERIEYALREKTGKRWSVTAGRTTASGWIRVQSPKSRKVSRRDNPQYNIYQNNIYPSQWEPPYLEYVGEREENQYTSEADCKLLAEAFGLSYVHSQGIYIGPDTRDNFVKVVEKDMWAEDPVAMPLEHPCQLCGRHPATVCTTCYDEAAQRTTVERAAADLLLLCRRAEELLSQFTPFLRETRCVLGYADPSHGGEE